MMKLAYQIGEEKMNYSINGIEITGEKYTVSIPHSR